MRQKALRDYYEKTVRALWKGSLGHNAYLSYDSSFRVHILPALGDVGLADLTRDRVKKFVAELRKKTVAKTEPPRLLSKETIRNIAAALRAGLGRSLRKQSDRDESGSEARQVLQGIGRL
jgi:Phage integrase, N-terminal SAM-like domain